MESSTYYSHLTKRIYGTIDGYRDVRNLMYHIEVMYEAFRKIRPILKENNKRDFKETFDRLKSHYRDLKYIRDYIKCKRNINIGELTTDFETESNSQIDESSYDSLGSNYDVPEANNLKSAINSMDRFLKRKQNYIVYTSPETRKEFHTLYKLIKKERDYCYNYGREFF
uniref:PIR Superfamily Protein n=1 Tax=Strongyloides venezuelensis TaxID=75913 RepID=A0A0K0EUJ0_STRVS